MKKAFEAIKRFGQKMWHAATPIGFKCIICSKEINNLSEGLCEKCMDAVSLIKFGYCQKCGSRVFGEGNFCEACGKNQHSFCYVRSVCEYDGIGRKLVHRLKFGSHRYLAKHMAYMMSEVAKNQTWQIDCVCFVPMTESKTKKRGYNQARLLAEELCDILCLPVCDCTKKVRETSAQATLNYAERMTNLKGAYVVESNAEIKGKNVLVVDDVKTTGATLSEMAAILTKSGAKSVYGLTFASRTQKTDLVLENTKWDF